MLRIIASDEKRLDVDIQYMGNLKKPPASDTVCAFFIFLDLLKCDAKLATERGLGYPLRKAI